MSTWLWALFVAGCVGAAVGYQFGLAAAPSSNDARTIEKRLREVFCEQIVKNNLMTTCEVN